MKVKLSESYRIVGIAFLLVLSLLSLSTEANAAEVNLTYISGYDTANIVDNVAVSGNYAYLADGFGGLVILNISDPSLPTLVGTNSTNKTSYVDDVAVSGNYAYLATEEGLVILNIINPAAPTLAGTYDTVGFAMDVAVSGNYAYVVDEYGLYILNITNPAIPTKAENYYIDEAKAVALSGNYAYITAYNTLEIVDISDPNLPIHTGNHIIDGYGHDIAVAGNYAHIANVDNGLLIVDITNPSLPTLAGSYDTTGSSNGIAVSGNYAYVADWETGLLAINITDPSLPTLAGSNDTAGHASGVAVSGNYVYVADLENGLVILRMDAAPTTVSYPPTYDNRLRESSACAVLFATPYLDAGKSVSRSRDVMWFDLSMYNTTDTISKATLSLYWYYPPATTRPSDTVVDIYRPVKWNPKYVTWYYRTYHTKWPIVGGTWFDKNNIFQGSSPYGSVTFSASKVPDNQYYEFDVTQLVHQYINGTYENTGFFLKARTEGGNYIAFYSSEWTIADQRPKLTITS